MRREQFIFSENRTHKLARHLAFWLVISTLFFIQSIIPVLQIYETAFISLCCFLPVCFVVTYVSIYFLLPFTIHRKQYIRFTLFFLLLTLIGFLINVAGATQFLQLADGYVAIHPTAKSGGLAVVNTSHAVVIAGLALGIKFTKNWYAQYRENGAEQRRKIRTELQLEKARLYPKFLFQSLYKLQNGIKSGSPRASELLIKISDLLSYIVYQSDAALISLEDELEMVRNRIEIELDDDDKKVHFGIAGNAIDKRIPPTALFSIVEDALKANENFSKTDSLLLVNIEVQDQFVTLKVRKDGMSPDQEEHFGKMLEAAVHRLEMLHQGGAAIQFRKGHARFSASIQISIIAADSSVNELMIAALKHEV